MPRSPKHPPLPEPLDLINHLRQCNLFEVRTKLEDAQRYYPDKYSVLADFIMSCKPSNHHDRPK
jgi:hypothetical protein